MALNNRFLFAEPDGPCRLDCRNNTTDDNRIIDVDVGAILKFTGTMETVKGQLSVYPVNTTNYCVLNEDSGSSFL